MYIPPEIARHIALACVQQNDVPLATILELRLVSKVFAAFISRQQVRGKSNQGGARQFAQLLLLSPAFARMPRNLTFHSLSMKVLIAVGRIIGHLSEPHPRRCDIVTFALTRPEGPLPVAGGWISVEEEVLCHLRSIVRYVREQSLLSLYQFRVRHAERQYTHL